MQEVHVGNRGMLLQSMTTSAACVAFLKAKRKGVPLVNNMAQSAADIHKAMDEDSPLVTLRLLRANNCDDHQRCTSLDTQGPQGPQRHANIICTKARTPRLGEH